MRLSCVVLLLLSALTLCTAWGDDVVPYTLNITSPQIYGGVMDAFRTQGLTVGYWASFTQNVGDRVRMRLALPPTGQDTACCLPPSCKFDTSLPQTLREWAAMQGSLLLIRRGDCLFHLKLIVAQNFGAAGAVVINDDDSPLLMAGSDGLPAVSIPGFAIGRTLGDFLEVTVQKSAVSVWVELAVVPIHFPMLGYVMTTAGTLAIVLCLLVPCILCCRLRSRRRRCLAEIRSTMQDVAAMKFDALMLRTNSEVTEVQQLQRAFVALVTRLLEYRSFIPAGLFHSPTAEDLVALPEKPASRSRTSSRRTSQQTPPPRQAPPIAVLPHQNSLTPTSVVSHRTSPGPTVRREMLSNSPNRMSRRTVAVMVVNALGFRSFVAVAGECHVEYVLGHYVATVHDFVSKARGHVDVVLGDQIFATFNAHVACPDAHTAAVATALDLRAVLTAGLLAGLLRIQIGVSGGQVFSGCTGYQPFKTLVTVGTPMKVAATFAHLANMDGAAVLVDPAVEERVRYSFKLRPVDAVFFPLSGQHSFPLSRAVTVFLVESRVIFQEAEWIYQVQDADCSEGWPGVFSNVLTADTHTQASLFLRRYLSLHPDDFYALRLQSRMPQWCPKRGVELREGPDVVQPEPPVPAAGLLSMAFLEEPPVPLFSPRAR